MVFNFKDLDLLKEIANIGSAHAATSLSNLLSRKVNISVPKVKILDFPNLSDIFGGGAELIVAATLVKVTGELNGAMMYFMKEEFACTLVNYLVGKKRASFYEFDEVDISAIEEVGNILINSYLNAITSFTSLSCKSSIPFLSIDMAGALLSVPAIEFGQISDEVWMLESTLKEDDLKGSYFLFIPAID